MDIEFRRTGERRYAVTVRRQDRSILEMSPAAGYDPRAYNDRLLLGLRGMLSEAELHVLRLRLDATQNIYDASDEEHILAAIARVTRKVAGKRSIVLVAENEQQSARLGRAPSQDGFGWTNGVLLKILRSYPVT